MIDYASRQRAPKKHIVSIGVVVLLHLGLFWAINSGMARKFVKVIKGPVEAQLLEEVKPDLPPPPPPPPPKDLPPRPPPPPPTYVPPSDVPLANAAPAEGAISAVTTVTPSVSAPPTPEPPPAPPQPSVRVAPIVSATNCQKPEYPSASRRLEEEGTVHLKMLVGVDGRVVQAEVNKSSGFPRLDDAAREALSKCLFKPGTVDDKPEQAWATMKYTWRLE